MIVDLNELYNEAKNASSNGDLLTFSILLDRVLREDISHTGAWELLYPLLGEGVDFKSFQRQFIQDHYPYEWENFNQAQQISLEMNLKSPTNQSN
ncbi:MAG: hypothetical protein FVQ83_16765 [Chloroflexi bacterium]|nr:hypothetical protein [Chloroflexota bacterium]